jgi:predicted nucleotidyltransferase/HEPN domain-containing protein
VSGQVTVFSLLDFTVAALALKRKLSLPVSRMWQWCVSLFDTFDDAVNTKLSSKRKSGQILKVILFGSMARGDWVDDKLSGYKSDYDLLVVVNNHTFTDLHEYWHAADERFIREFTVTQHITAPVNFIVHDLGDVNDQLARGRPFFSDIARDGIVLYEAPGHPLAKPKSLTQDEVRAEALGYYEQWIPKARNFLIGYETYRNISNRKLAVFTLHQAVESLYHCLLLVLTLYSPKSHRITMLRSQAEALDDRLKVIWPNDTKLHRQAFDRLRRAYVEARYSAAYEITDEELAWIAGQVQQLQQIVGAVCEDRLNPAHLSD